MISFTKFESNTAFQGGAIVSVYQVEGSGLAQLTSDWFDTDISYQAPSLTRIDGANF